MIGIIFSLDYEIYGTGKGDFERLMLDPTDKLLDMLDRHGAKLTIMADVAEILAIKNHSEYDAISERVEQQLKRAIETGHDVQLHLHPGWFNATFDGKKWTLDFEEYALVGLGAERINRYIKQGKDYLEGLLTPVDPDYQCIAYRAGNWLMQPSEDIVAALETQGFVLESSVYKGGGGQVGQYTIDYHRAHHDILPWRIDPNDINRAVVDRDGLIEVPILCRPAFIGSMLTLKRIKLQLQLRRDSQLDNDNETKESESESSSDQLGSGKGVTRPKLIYPKKFDFCRLSAREMKGFLKYAESVDHGRELMTPMVAIGHSTEYIDDGQLEKFVRYVNRQKSSQATWMTFREYASAKIL